MIDGGVYVVEDDFLRGLVPGQVALHDPVHDAMHLGLHSGCPVAGGVVFEQADASIFLVSLDIFEERFGAQRRERRHFPALPLTVELAGSDQDLLHVLID